MPGESRESSPPEGAEPADRAAASAPTGHCSGRDNAAFRAARLSSRRRLLAASLLVAGLALAAVLLLREPAPAPPAVPPGTSPSIAAAVSEARQAVLDSDTADTWGELGMLFLAHDFVDQADACFQRAEQLEPREFRWPYLRGVSLAYGRPLAAADCYRRAIELRGNIPAMRLRLAELLIELERLDEAEAHAERALDLQPGNARAELALARIAYLRSRFHEALDWAQRAERSAPGRRDVHFLLMQLYTRTGDSASAEEQAHLLPELPERGMQWPDPILGPVLARRQDADWAAEVAQQLLAADRPAEAVAVLEDAAAREPGHAEVRILLAQVLIATRNDRRAHAVLDEAVRIAPLHAEAHFHRGVAYYFEERWAEAAASFRRAAEIKPDYADAHYNLGHCLIQLDDPEGAIDAFEQAVRFQPGDARAHVNLAELLIEQGQTARGREHLEIAHRLAPEDPNVQALMEELRQ